MQAAVRELGDAARVLLVIDQPVLAEYVKLALSHGAYLIRTVQTAEEALAMLGAWRPHLAVVDMDIAHGAILERLNATGSRPSRVAVIALTRRGDLKTKLAAFDAGVDDILTVPFSPEELVARLLAIMRRTYGATVTFTPVLRLGDLEIDILNRRIVVGGSELHLT